MADEQLGGLPPALEATTPPAPTLKYRTATPAPWTTAALMGLQLVVPHLVADLACAGADTIELRTKLIAATLVYGGVTTLLQTSLGLRLAVLQGPAFAFIPPLYAFARQPDFECRASAEDTVSRDVYMAKLQLVMGSCLAAGLLQMALGATGLIGVVARRVGPLTICPLMILLSIGNCAVVLEKSSLHWLSIVQFSLLLLFIYFIADVKLPIPIYSGGAFRVHRMPIFGTFPYLISIVLTWGLATVLTHAELEPAHSPARVDRPQSMRVVTQTPWLQIPYPGQFGIGQFSLPLFLGLLSAIIACSVESVGAYTTLARVSEERPPSSRVINRATVVQGIGCVLFALSGCGVSVTAYCENVAIVAITRMASRRIIQGAAVVMILLGVFTKFAALLAAIPDPLVGGIFGMSVCLVCGVSLSNLQSVDLRSSRNLTILGLAIILGILIPNHVEKNPIRMGVTTLDQALSVLLTTRMFVGGFIAFMLDNLSPSTDTVAAAISAEQAAPLTVGESLASHLSSGYCFPAALNARLLHMRFLQLLPFMPSREELVECRRDAQLADVATHARDERAALTTVGAPAASDELKKGGAP